MQPQHHRLHCGDQAGHVLVAHCCSGIAWDASGLWQAVSFVCNTTLMRCVRDKLSGAPLPLPRGMPRVQQLNRGSAKPAASEHSREEEEGVGEGGGEAPSPLSPECSGADCGCSEEEQRLWSAVGECRREQEKVLKDLGPVCGSSAYFVYAGLLSILPRYPTAAGFPVDQRRPHPQLLEPRKL